MATAAVQLPSDVSNTLNPFSNTSHAPETVSLKKSNKKFPNGVNTTLNFFKDSEDGTPPAPTYVDRPTTYERPRNKQDVTINDVTGEESSYTLDSHGFQFVNHVSQEKDFIDDDAIKEHYYKEVDQILKQATGATRTFIFDHTIRRAAPKSDGGRAANIRGPVQQVHIDQSYDAALSRVPFHLPEDAEHLLKGRYQLINVWRPIKTVKRDPLAVAAANSVSDDDLVPIGLIYATRKGETLSVRHNSQQKWFFKYHQTPEEVLLIKCFDNKAGEEYGNRAKRVPHSAFELPGTQDEESRESIEVRALVFNENDVE